MRLVPLFILLLAGAHAKPNIVLIMADDHGYECLGANGGESYQTPHLDRLAAEGIRFEHCYSQPICTPSRVKLMTGLSNVRNYSRFGRLDRDQRTFAHLLKEAGYATGIGGKWQLGSEPGSARHFGFDESLLWQHTRGRTRKVGGKSLDTRFSSPLLDLNGEPLPVAEGKFGPDLVADFACDFFGRHKDRPFFFYYPMLLTHCPFVPTPDSKDWDPADPGSPSYRGEDRHFADMVAYTDKIVGRLVARLDELGIRENTLILFTGDNGTDKGIASMLNGREVIGGKGSPTDAGNRVPFVANWPGTIPAGQVSRDIVDFSDFVPTFCEVAGVEIPENLDGRSFLPQLRGEPGNPREWIYQWYSRAGTSPPEAVFARDQRFKLYDDGRLFDIPADPLEKNPLAADAEPTIRTKLQAAIDHFADARPARLLQNKKRGK